MPPWVNTKPSKDTRAMDAWVSTLPLSIKGNDEVCRDLRVSLPAALAELHLSRGLYGTPGSSAVPQLQFRGIAFCGN
jgi:hypothetical protein